MTKISTEQRTIPIPTFQQYNRSPAIPFYQDILYKGWLPIPTYASVHWSDIQYTWGHVLGDLLYERTQWDISMNPTGTERRLTQRDANGTITWDTTQKIVSGRERKTTTDEGVPVTYQELAVDEFAADGSYLARVTFTDEPPNVCAEWMREVNDFLRPLW